MNTFKKNITVDGKRSRGRHKKREEQIRNKMSKQHLSNELIRDKTN